MTLRTRQPPGTRFQSTLSTTQPGVRQPQRYFHLISTLWCYVLWISSTKGQCPRSGESHTQTCRIRTCQRSEGLWDSQPTARIAEKVMSIEESSARHILRLQKDDTLTDSLQAPVQARISVSGIQFRKDGYVIVRYQARDPNASVRELERIYGMNTHDCDLILVLELSAWRT